MYLLVYKFGGSSVADAAGLRRAAKQLADAAAAGYHIVAVVSAQGKTTDRLLQIAAGNLGVCMKNPFHDHPKEESNLCSND